MCCRMKVEKSSILFFLVGNVRFSAYASASEVNLPTEQQKRPRLMAVAQTTNRRIARLFKASNTLQHLTQRLAKRLLRFFGSVWWAGHETWPGYAPFLGNGRSQLSRGLTWSCPNNGRRLLESVLYRSVLDVRIVESVVARSRVFVFRVRDVRKQNTHFLSLRAMSYKIFGNRITTFWEKIVRVIFLFRNRWSGRGWFATRHVRNQCCS